MIRDVSYHIRLPEGKWNHGVVARLLKGQGEGTPKRLRKVKDRLEEVLPIFLSLIMCPNSLFL